MKITSRTSLYHVVSFLSAVTLIASAFVFPASGDEEKVTIKQMIGNVEVRSAHTGAWRAARVGMIVRAGWDLRTFVESNAELLYETGTVIKVGENTVITLSALGQSANAVTQTDVKVSTGQIWSNVKKLTSASSKFEFETPTAVASIRGTRLGVSVGNDSSSIDVYEGIVMVRNKGSGREMAVMANTRAEVVAGKAGVKTITFSAIGNGQNGPNVAKDPFATGTGADTSTHQKADTSTVKPDTGRKVDTTGMGNAKSTATLSMTLTAPLDGAVITSPLITVSGKTVAGAKVTVNGVQATVSSSGAFTYQIPIPDEPQAYSLEIIATYNDNENRMVRNVTYAPNRGPLQLVVTSPVAGQVIEQKILHIIGKSGQGAQVTVNGQQALITPNGQFTFDLPLAEKDIGTLTLDFAAARDDGELTQSMDVVVDVASPQINTSVPRLIITGIGQQAVNTSQLQIQVLDATPEDQDTVTVLNNGAKEILVIDPGAKEPITLNEGMNNLVIKCNDKAGNWSNQIQTSIYYLPGPITIDVQDPAENLMSIQDLPPFPGNTKMKPLHFTILLDEGVGRLTDIYQYCKVISSSGQSINLHDNKDCSFSGDVPIARGATLFTIQVQDIAGNVATKNFTMRINQ